MLNLFIDTNIFLTFYHFTKEDLDELEKLKIAVNNGEITLYLTQQVKDEFFRNREGKINDALKPLQDLKFGQIPSLCKQYLEECKKLRKTQRDFEDIRTHIIERVVHERDTISLPPDKIVIELFGKAEFLYSSAFIGQARIRFDCGNPPGKHNSYGDAINWETLLATSLIKGDLYFISNDGDYASDSNENQFSSFLANEWHAKNGTDIHFYRELSKFFQENYPNIKLAEDLGKEFAIRNLVESPAYSFTHDAISHLSQYAVFSIEDTEHILQATMANGQIYRILSDIDVQTFLDRLLKENGPKINKVLFAEFNQFRQKCLAAEQKASDAASAILNGPNPS